MQKIFGTDGIRCKVNQEPMTAETCLKIAKAAGFILSNKKLKKNRVIISKDTRLSGYLFEPLITSGFVSMGMDVILLGPLPTPALPILIKSLRADMGVMITASHNTYEYNGLKFFDSYGSKISADLEKKIEKIVSFKKYYNKILNLDHKSGRAVRFEDAAGRYSEYLKSTIDKKTKLKKFKVVLDCGNGATYNIAPNLFWELGVEIISINDRPDGKNINKNCGAVNIKQLSNKVLELKGDIGFAFDGDGDRVIVVDNKGKKVDGDKIIALLAKSYFKKNNLNKNTVVTTVMSNIGLENYLKEKLNIKLIRTKVGDVNVISEMKKKSYTLGGEESGHIILGNHMNTGDGILTAIKILEIMSMQKLNSNKLFDIYDDYPQIKSNLIIQNPKLSLDRKLSHLSKKIIKKFPKYRFLIRKSGTEPLVRILVEGKNEKKVIKYSNMVNEEVKKILNA